LVDIGARITIVDLLQPGSGANYFNISGIEDRVNVVIGDICDSELIGSLVEGQNFLFNLAGQVGHLASLHEPLVDNKNNALAALILLEECRQRNPGIKIVYAGTRQIYGRPNYLPVDELHPLEPVDYNGVSKLTGEMYHLVCHRIYGLHTSIIRMSNVFGPGMRVKDDRQTFIGWWFRQLIEGDELQVFGTGMQTRDLIYVDNVVDALLLTVVNPTSDGQIYNLGGGRPISLLDLAQNMVEINGYGSYRLVPFPEERKQIDIGNFYADTRKIESHLNWRSKISLKEGIASTLNFYRKYKEHYW
jgi:UDP-glucose 4-epimerase